MRLPYIPHPGTGSILPVGTDGRVRPASGPVGYLRLTSFSGNAAAEMKAAIQELEVGAGRGRGWDRGARDGA